VVIAALDWKLVVQRRRQLPALQHRVLVNDS